MTFPAAPWRLRGDMWLSVFQVRAGTSERAPGWYAAGFADYSGSALAYRELLVARPVGIGVGPRVTVTDIWVDSVTSRDGGRALWAVPKELAELHHDHGDPDHGDPGHGDPGRGGQRARHRWRATADGSHLAAATFGDPPRGPRLPCALTTRQQRADGSTVVARASGSARVTPCPARWEVDPAGPLAWLRGRRPVCTLALRDLRLTFGRWGVPARRTAPAP